MKQRTGIAIVVMLIFGALIYYSEFRPSKKSKIFYPNITYKTKSYRPYDTKFVFEQFKQKSKKGFVLNEETLDEDNKNIAGSDKLLVIVSPDFLPNQAEVNKIIGFAHEGNNVLVSAFTISPTFINGILGDSLPHYQFLEQPAFFTDSLTLFWENSQTQERQTYSYPGTNPVTPIDAVLKNANGSQTSITDVYENNQLIDIQISTGHIYVLLSPISLTNYFLLHKQNHTYLNRIMKQIGAENRTIIWDKFYEKYTQQRPEPTENNEAGESYFWKVINEHPPLLWAIISFFLAIGLFILINTRRVQAPVAVIPEIQNNSVEFIEALSGLYWLKQDHKKIAEKIIIQFYDYLSVNYRIIVKDVNRQNAEKISQKTNKKTEDVEKIITMIEKIEDVPVISKQYLTEFYVNVHKFINS